MPWVWPCPSRTACLWEFIQGHRNRILWGLSEADPNVINGIKKDLDMRWCWYDKESPAHDGVGHSMAEHQACTHFGLPSKFIVCAASEFVQDLMYPLWFNHIQGDKFCITLQILIPIATSKSFQHKSSIMFVLSCHNFDGMKYNKIHFQTRLCHGRTVCTYPRIMKLRLSCTLLNQNWTPMCR